MKAETSKSLHKAPNLGGDPYLGGSAWILQSSVLMQHIPSQGPLNSRAEPYKKSLTQECTPWESLVSRVTKSMRSQGVP